MNPQRVSEHLTATIVTLLGIGFAIYCGRLAGGGQKTMIVLLFLGMVSLSLLLILKEKLWMLMLLLWAFPGQIPELPLPFTVRQLGVMFVSSSFLALIALKVIRRKMAITSLDLLLYVNLAYLTSALIRNPVGTLATGSERIGGRPYLDVAIGFLAYLVLSRVSMDRRDANRLPFLMILGHGLQAVIGGVTYLFPQTVPLFSDYYTGISTETYSGVGGQDPVARHGYLHGITQPISVWLCSRFRPLTLINPVYFWRFLGLALTAGAMLFTGFRSAFAALGFYFLLASYLHRGAIDMVRALTLLAPVLGLVLLMQGTIIQLPTTAQRALSFLPGKWDTQAVADAEGSTQWRVEMWREMIFTDRFIKNKILGDGFGFSQREFQIQKNIETMGIATPAEMQEYFMLVGGVHSGPVSAIRYVGVVGLIMYMALTIAMAREAFRLIRRAQGTGFDVPVLFICLPIIYDPVGYVLIFGALESNYPFTLLNLGLLKLVRNALDDASHAGEAQPRLEHLPSDRMTKRPNVAVGFRTTAALPG